jgi:serine protease Do
MPFPIQPEAGKDERNFPVHDPFDLRTKILPLFYYDKSTELLSGLGASFKIDPFGEFLTAQHVLEDYFLPSNTLSDRLVGLLSPGLRYGTTNITPDHFVRIKQTQTFRERIDDPMAALRGQSQTRNSFDCLKFAFEAGNTRLDENKDFLPVRIKNRELRLGERVMAIGYPELTCLRNVSLNTVATLRESMRGAIGKVSALFPEGRMNRKWPTFQVDVPWPKGMSGGPVFNEDGEVVGLVSSSDEPETENARSYAFWFEHVSYLAQWLPSLDPVNPGWIKGWAVIQENPLRIKVYTRDRSQAEKIKSSHYNDCIIRLVSRHHRNGEFTQM